MHFVGSVFLFKLIKFLIWVVSLFHSKDLQNTLIMYLVILYYISLFIIAFDKKEFKLQINFLFYYLHVVFIYNNNFRNTLVMPVYWKKSNMEHSPFSCESRTKRCLSNSAIIQLIKSNQLKVNLRKSTYQ